MAKKPAKAAKTPAPAKKKPAPRAKRQDITRPDDADRDPAPNTAVTWIGADIAEPTPDGPQPDETMAAAYHDAPKTPAPKPKPVKDSDLTGPWNEAATPKGEDPSTSTHRRGAFQR